MKDPQMNMHQQLEAREAARAEELADLRRRLLAAELREQELRSVRGEMMGGILRGRARAVLANKPPDSVRAEVERRLLLEHGEYESGDDLLAALALVRGETP